MLVLVSHDLSKLFSSFNYTSIPMTLSCRCIGCIHHPFIMGKSPSWTQKGNKLTLGFTLPRLHSRGAVPHRVSELSPADKRDWFYLWFSESVVVTLGKMLKSLSFSSSIKWEYYRTYSTCPSQETRA